MKRIKTTGNIMCPLFMYSPRNFVLYKVMRGEKKLVEILKWKIIRKKLVLRIIVFIKDVAKVLRYTFTFPINSVALYY
jgi:hypothetical protein